MGLKDALRLPVVTLAAEYLTIGYLMRRNILAYKAPPNQEGYDLICVNPEPQRTTRTVRVQVKSRYATDSNQAFMVRSRKLDAADYVVLVLLNVGFFYRKRPVRDGAASPNFYTLPAELVRAHLSRSKSDWERLLTKSLDLGPYKDELGFELIAHDLSIPYPQRGAS